MAFIQPCFIRKNTPELRKKLEELGYKPFGSVKYEWDTGWGLSTDNRLGEFESFDDNGLENIIKCGPPDYEDSIDCGENVGLFLSLAALRDDSDYMQWFINYYGYCQFCWDKNVEDYKSGYGREMYRIIDETYHKMSAEELIEHAEIIEKRYEI